ncbi:MAG: lipopolysaccharide biosynthesis protein [Thermogemmata sp.]|nr:lipopolysaccharide biosynthesis protein [Thermogemmata sp.]
MNLLAAHTNALVGIVTGFVATPYLLHWLGVERVGLFRVATEWAGYLTLFEVGVSGALAPLIVQARASTNPNQLIAMLVSGFRAYARVAAYSLIAGAILLLMLPALARTPPDLEFELRLGFAVSLLTHLVLPLYVYKALADAMQRNYLISMLLTLQTVFTAAGCVAAAYSGWGLVGQFGVTALGTVIVPLGLLILLWHYAPLWELLRPPIDLTDATRRLRGLNRDTLIYQLVGRVCLFTDTAVVSLVLGPAAAAIFFVTTRLPQAISTQVQAMGGATWAGLAELYQNGQHERFRRRLIELTRFTAIFSGAVLVPCAILTRPFVELWVGPELYAGDWVCVLAVLNGYLLPVYSLWGWAFTGIGRVRRLLLYMVGQGILNAAGSIAATWAFGIAGPLIGTALVNLLYNPWLLVRYLRADFDLTPAALLSAVIVPLLPALVLATGLFVTREILLFQSWWLLVVVFGTFVVVYLCMTWWFILGDGERAWIRHMTRRILSPLSL